MAEATQVPDKLDPNVVMHRNITKLESSDFYKQLSPAKKVAVQTKFYNQFVVPAQKSLNYKGDLKEWLKGRAGKLTTSGETSTTEKALGAVGHGTLSFTKPLVKGAEYLADKAGLDTSKARQVSDRIYRRDEDWIEQHYDKHLKDQAIKEVGTFAGQTPALMMGSGILKAIGLTDLLGPGVAQAPKMVQIGSRMLHSAIDGYIFGAATGDDPVKSAEGFALGSELFRPVETYIGKLLGLGGQKLVKETVESATKAVSEKAPEATGEIPAIVTALAGSPKQKINATTIQALNDLTGGNFATSSKAAQEIAIHKLGRLQPAIADELGFINQHIVEAKAAAQTLKQRAMVPEFNKVLTDLEKIDGTPTPKAVAQSVAEKAKNRQIVKRASSKPQVIVPGAASAGSYEFEDNLSKRVGQGLDKLGLGKDKLVWEDRGHKLLFYLNLLLTDQKSLGPSKERNKQFQFLLQHLNDRYKDATLPDLVKMSDNLWTHIEQLTKAGIMEEGKPTRIFRQLELREGESPFGHQVKLLHDAQTKEINDRMDIDAFNKLKEKHGPGAAAATDPNFVGKKYGEHADLLNKLPHEYTGTTQARYNDINGRQTLSHPMLEAGKQLDNLYKNDSHFKNIADASRHYVHNNKVIIDGSRLVTGKEPLFLNSDQMVHGKTIGETTMFNGVKESRRVMSINEAKEHAENLFTAIRETKENNIPKYRGMTFDTAYTSDQKNYKIFRDLKIGDKIDIPLSSFSTKSDIASRFMSESDNMANVILQLKGEHKSLNLKPFNKWSEEEHLTEGAFEVVNTELKDYKKPLGVGKKSDKHLVITIKQIGTF